MVNRTKIVCTIGPAVATREKIKSLLVEGMNVARLNFSHGTYEEHAHNIALLKAARKSLKCPMAIMLDTKGPEIRLGKLKSEQVEVKEGHSLWLVAEELEGTATEITLSPPSAIDVLEKDMFLLLDDGYIITHVVKVEEGRVQVMVDHGGVIRSTRGVNIPGATVPLPPMTSKDIEDIRFGCKQDIDIVAASFVRSSDHVMSIKKLLEKEGRADIAVVAKIENREGMDNLDSILQVADGIMIARGDLGVELPLAQVPRLQKVMIRKCSLAAKPSITATQMLESMRVNIRATRAEASDVANSIYDSTSAVMLSAETAIGKYPIETITFMKSVIEETEKDFDYYEFFKQATQRFFPDVPTSVAQASIKTAYSANAKAIFAFTTSGLTARLLSRLRPKMPIIAMTPNTRVYHQLALAWGVIPLLCKEANNIEDAKKRISEYALEHKIVAYGDLVVITAGTPFGQPGTTNMMIVDSIGEVLVRGSEGMGKRVRGDVMLFPSPEEKVSSIKEKIIVINSCGQHYRSLLKQALGVIMQNHVDDTESERYLKQMAAEFHLSIIVRAEGASEALENGQIVTLEPSQAIVCK